MVILTPGRHMLTSDVREKTKSKNARRFPVGAFGDDAYLLAY
jgi:hypothetical protein